MSLFGLLPHVNRGRLPWAQRGWTYPRSSSQEVSKCTFKSRKQKRAVEDSTYLGYKEFTQRSLSLDIYMDWEVRNPKA